MASLQGRFVNSFWLPPPASLFSLGGDTACSVGATGDTPALWGAEVPGQTGLVHSFALAFSTFPSYPQGKARQGKAAPVSVSLAVS